jgi:hypothetical protein
MRGGDPHITFMMRQLPLVRSRVSMKCNARLPQLVGAHGPATLFPYPRSEGQTDRDEDRDDADDNQQFDKRDASASASHCHPVS